MNWIKPSHIFWVLISATTVFLAVRALQPTRWTDWAFGEAQTLFTVDHWNKRGWVENKFLFLPTPYIPSIRALEDPELIQHAHGNLPRSSQGPTLYYTHYPPGYIMPFALLDRLGGQSLYLKRWLAISFSIGAVIFFFLGVQMFLGSQLALITSLFYLQSPAFLKYADTISNQPLDDFLRMAGFFFLTRYFLITRSHATFYLFILTQVILSLSSLDSTFFLLVYAFLGSWLLQIPLSFRQKIFVSLSFIAAPTALVLQNIWYAGWHNSIQDLTATLLSRAGSQSDHWALSYLSALIGSFHNNLRDVLATNESLAFFIFLLFCLLGQKLGPLATRTKKLLGLLFFCGFSFILVLPKSASQSYQQRQLLPFVAVFLSLALMTTYTSLKTKRNAWNTAATIGLLLILLQQSQLLRSPAFQLSQIGGDLNIAQRLHSKGLAENSVILSLGGFGSYWAKDYYKGYPQIHPVVEYYAGRPILVFANHEQLEKDRQILQTKYPGIKLIYVDNNRILH